MRWFQPLTSAATAALFSATLLSGAPTQAQTTSLRYAVGFPTGAAPESARVYAEAVKKHSNNTLNIRVFDLSLLNLSEMSGGVKQGVADIGYVLTPYFPAEYPHLNMATELSMLLALRDDPGGKGGLAYGGAMAEFAFTKCPECAADFARQNQLYTSTGGSSNYMLLCNKPMRTQADLKGARLRAGGAAWARWAREMGATPASMSGNEVFEALHQKVVDCAIISAPELSGLNLKDAVTHITTDLPGGAFSGATSNVNLDAWRKLDAVQRTALLRGGAVLGAEVSMRYLKYGQRDLERAKAKGAQIAQADPALVQASRKAIEADIQTIATNYAKQHNVKRAEEIVATMRQLVDRWMPLVQKVENAEQLAQLYWDEVYSKVDVKTYGAAAR